MTMKDVYRHTEYWLWLVAVLLTACTTDEPATTRRQQTVEVKMTICLQSDMAVTTRAMGDPGTYEHFEFPQYFYIYAVGFTDPGGDYLEASGGTVCPLKDGDNDVNRIDMGNSESNWARYLMTVDPPQTLMDSIYGSTRSLSIPVPEGITKMRFYVAASAVPLKRYVGGEWKELGVGDQVLRAANNEYDVLGLMFDVDDALKEKLHCVWSSPYNYRPASSPYNGEYYYTINNPSQPVDITRIIYHVATKVDLDWNVVKAMQPSVQISYIEAQGLKDRDCLLFKPTENADNTATSSYSQELMSDDVGQQWYGRRYFYCIPYAETFNVKLHMLKLPDGKTTDPAPGGYNLTLQKSMAGFTVFTPWLRADLRFSSGMGYGTVTQSLD